MELFEVGEQQEPRLRPAAQELGGLLADRSDYAAARGRLAVNRRAIPLRHVRQPLEVRLRLLSAAAREVEDVVLGSVTLAHLDELLGELPLGLGSALDRQVQLHDSFLTR